MFPRCVNLEKCDTVVVVIVGSTFGGRGAFIHLAGISFFIFVFTFIYLFVGAGGGVCTPAMAPMWWSEDNMAGVGSLLLCRLQRFNSSYQVW